LQRKGKKAEALI